ISLRPPRPTLFPYTTLFRSLVTSGELLRLAPFLVTELKLRVLFFDTDDFLRLRIDERDDRPALVVVVQADHDVAGLGPLRIVERSEEHTSELQSRFDLVCRL